MSDDSKAREYLCKYGMLLYSRCLTSGSTGNISVAHPDGGWLMTPTNVALGELDPGKLARIDPRGRHIDGDSPTKEVLLHLAMYERQERFRAVVHLHSTHAVAVSCLKNVNIHDCLPPITAYYVMRVGRLPLVPYFPPGDPLLADAVRKLAGEHHAVLLANHGPVVAGDSLENAGAAIEELEETAKLHLLLQSHVSRPLTEEQVDTLRQRFGA
jgi:ribulose-5-phosphate 4-epimerase/fuculose-1-phosphate aldolase